MLQTSEISPHAQAERQLSQAFRDGLRPDEELSVSAWADRYRQLSQLSSAEFGQWVTDRAPYLREPMDALSVGSEVREVDLQWAAQMGKTEILNNFVGYIVDQCPGPIMYVMPTDKLAKRASRTRIEPMFEETPRLRGKLKENKALDKKQTRLEKVFPGGIVIMVGSNSAADLRSSPCKFIVADECDGYPLDVEGEGDPLSLVEERTANYHGHKILKCSTPTFADTSRIEQATKQGDMRRYSVPCPHCEKFQFLEWKNLRWEEGRPETAAYACEHCGALIEERFKPEMLAGGKWVPTNPKPKRGVRSYLLSKLYAPLGWESWERLAEKWIASENDKEKRRVFVNLSLGETWRDGGEVPSWERLWNRREDYKAEVPMRALSLTAGVDVQGDRLEIEVVGWGRGMESWNIAYHVLPGDPMEEEVWNDLDQILGRQFAHESGRHLPIRFLCIDSKHKPDRVYRWVRRHSLHQVAAVNGRDLLPLILAQPTKVEITEAGKRRRRGAQLWPIGSGIIKRMLYDRLQLELPGGEGKLPPPGFCHFPKARGQEWFEQLVAETLRTRSIGGHRRRSITYWEKTRERNEALDCRIYATAAAAIAGIDRFQEHSWREIEEALGIAPGAALAQDEPAHPPQLAEDGSSTEPGTRAGFFSRWRTR